MRRLERILWFICFIAIILAPSIFAHRSDRSPQVATVSAQSAGDVGEPVGDFVTPDDTTLIKADATAGNMTVTLPDAATVANVTYKVVKVDTTTNTVTVVAVGGDTIGNSANYVLKKELDSLTVTSDNTNYVSVVPMESTVDVRLFGVTGDGVTDDKAAIELAAVQAAGNDLRFPPGTYLIGSDLTLDENLIMDKGAVLEPDNGVTLTVSGHVTAGSYEVFSGASNGSTVLSPFADQVADIAWTLGDGNDFTDAVDELGFIPIQLSQHMYDVLADTTFTDEVVVVPGAEIDVDDDDTLTIEGPIDLPDSQVFIDATDDPTDGTVIFDSGSVSEVLPVWFGADGADAVGGGESDDALAIQAAIDAGATNIKSVRIPAGLYNMLTDVDIQDSLLMLDAGTILQLAAGQTLTIGSGTLEAGLYQVFQGNGTVVFEEGAVEHILPQWWGAVGDGVNDDTAEIQAAFDAVAAGGTVLFPMGSYKVTTELLIDKSTVTIKAAGAVIPYYESPTNHSFTAANGIMLEAAGVDDAWNVVVQANDVLVLTSDQGGPVSLDVPDGRYNRAGLGVALQTALNNDATLTGGTITFVVTYSSATEKYTIDATVGHTVAYTDSGSDGGALFGFTADAGAAQTITSDTALPIAVVRIKAGLVTWDGIGIDGEEGTVVDYGIWLDGSEASIGSYTAGIQGNVIKNCAVVDFYKASAVGVYDGTWFTHIENMWVRNIRDGTGIDVRRLNTLESSTTHTIEKVVIQYCELAFRVDADTQGVTIRDTAVISCRIGLAAFNCQLYLDNVQWENIGYDIGGSSGFISDQLRGFFRSGDFLEGPIYLNGTSAKFHKNQFQYVVSAATGTATAGWWRHGWFVCYATANEFSRGATITLDHCEFARLYDTTSEAGYKLFRYRADSNVRTLAQNCEGLDRLDYDQCSLGEGYTLRSSRSYWYETDPVEFVNGRFIATYDGVPDWGGWEIGDLIYDPANGNKARECITAGYNRTIAANVSTTNGSDEITITTPATGFELPVGSYITIVGVTGTKKIVELMTATKRKIDVVADATVVAAAAANADAVFAIPNDRFSYSLAGEILGEATTPPLILVWVTPATTEADLSGNGNDATYSNFATIDQIYKGDVWDLSFYAGSNEYLTVGDDAAFSWDDTGSNPWSVCVWVEVIATASIQTVIGKYNVQGTDREWLIRINTDETITLFLFDEADDKQSSNFTDAALSEGWHFLVHTYDSTGGAAALSDTNSVWYVDGVAVAESQANDADYTGMVAGATDITIGGYNTGAAIANFFQGDMGIIWIEDAELNASQVWSAYINTRGYYSE